MKTFFVIGFLILSHYVFSQELNRDALKIKIAFEKLSKQPSNKRFQKGYLNVFPSKTKIFLSVFHPVTFDQLYMESDQYIEFLKRCSKSYPPPLLALLLNL